MSGCQVTSENNTFVITDTGAAEVQATMVETNVRKTGRGEERNDEVPEKVLVLSPSTDRGVTLADSKGVKRESQPSHHSSSKADVDLYSNTNTRIAPPTSAPRSPPKSPSRLPSTQATLVLEKLELRSETTRDTVPKAYTDFDKMAVVETNVVKPDQGEGQRNEGDEKASKQTNAEPKTGHGVTHSVRDTVTIAEPDATEAQVRSAPCDDVRLNYEVMAAIIATNLFNAFFLFSCWSKL